MEQSRSVGFAIRKVGDPVIALARGARPSPRHRLAAATPHRAVVPTPESFLCTPAQLSIWGNDVNGDCVTAEEAFAKACQPHIFIPDETVIAWATMGGFLNGADLTTVMTAMEAKGFTENGSLYDDGPYTSVDWTNAAVLKNAIGTVGPVKIGVAADQLQNTVQTLANGWFATGYTQDTNEDHCVSLCGYGTMNWLAKHLGVTVPAGLDGTQQAYALFTWGTIGIIDVRSMIAITGEAWLRNPTSVVKKSGE